jgi:hypothetical protein
MRNASQRKDIRRAEKFAEEQETKRINFIVAAMSTEAGRAWFHDILSLCHVFRSDYIEDPRLDARIGGERNIGLILYNSIVTHCPDYFVLMMKEATILEKVNERRAESDDADDDESAGDEYAGSEDSDGGDY